MDAIVKGGLQVILTYKDKMLLKISALSAIQFFIHARDQALYKALFFFAGDRAVDLLQVKVSPTFFVLPIIQVLLYNHIWTAGCSG